MAKVKTKKKPKANKTKKKLPVYSKWIIDGLWPLVVKIDDLHEDPVNARKHGERNLAATEASLTKFKQRKPVVVNKRTGIIEAGNGTFACAKNMGWTHIAAVFVDDDPTTATGYSIADNRTAELAEWDLPVLSNLLKALNEAEADMSVTGFADFELEPLLAAEFGGIDDPGWDPDDEPLGGGSEPENDGSYPVLFTKKQWSRIKKVVEAVKGKHECDASEAIVRLIAERKKKAKAKK